MSDKLKAASLHNLLTHELHDLYDGEHQIIDAMPMMIETASSQELKDALRTHFEETKKQITKLEKCFQAMNEEPKRMTCDGMKGILKEGEHVMKGEMDPAVKDDALIGAAQRVEHYEMAGYGTARDHAQYLGLDEVATILDEILQEEGNADKTLTKIAKSMYRELAKV